MTVGEGLGLYPGSDFRSIAERVLEQRDTERIISFGTYIGLFVAREIDTLETDIVTTISERFASDVEPPLNKAQMEKFKTGAAHAVKIRRNFDHHLVATDT